MMEEGPGRRLELGRSCGTTAVLYRVAKAGSDISEAAASCADGEQSQSCVTRGQWAAARWREVGSKVANNSLILRLDPKVV